MLSVVTWQWTGHNLSKRNFEAAHVNVLKRMFERHLGVPHRFICLTDESQHGYDSGIELMTVPPAAGALAALPSPEGGRFPSCYRRLWAFSEEAQILGEQILCIDIDVVIVGSITHLIRDADFVGWKPKMRWGPLGRYAGGQYLLKTARRRKVWEDFQGARSISLARSAGFRGSDQAWLSYKLGSHEQTWVDEGVYSIRDLQEGRGALPPDARIVHLNGPVKPWQSPLPWVRDNWR